MSQYKIVAVPSCYQLILFSIFDVSSYHGQFVAQSVYNMMFTEYSYSYSMNGDVRFYISNKIFTELILDCFIGKQRKHWRK